jgi:hypothetical protein
MFDRWGDDPRDYTDDARDDPSRDHDRDDGHPELGRGPGSDHEKKHHDWHSRDDERWPDRGRDPRDKDPREVFTKHLDLPRGLERERVADARERSYSLRESESRSLATVGAFRVVSAHDLRDHHDRPGDPRDSDLRHLREQGLIQTVHVDGRRDAAIVLTDGGRDLLEATRDRERDRSGDPRGLRRRNFYARTARCRIPAPGQQEDPNEAPEPTLSNRGGGSIVPETGHLSGQRLRDRHPRRRA